MLPTISAREMIVGMLGAWRLIHFDRGGVQYFDATVEGFWKSFYAAAIVLPGFLIIRAIFLATTPEAAPTAGPVRVAVVFAIAYVVQWVAFPLAMFYLTDLLNRSRYYVVYVVAHNWSQVIQIMIFLPAGLLLAAGGNGASAWGAAAYDVTFVIALAYAWFVARAALDISGIAAAFVVLTEFLLDVMILGVSDLLTGRL